MSKDVYAVESSSDAPGDAYPFCLGPKIPHKLSGTSNTMTATVRSVILRPLEDEGSLVATAHGGTFVSEAH